LNLIQPTGTSLSREFGTEPPTHRELVSLDIPDRRKPLIQFESVWLKYLRGNDFAVEDISLEVADGEFIAIVGPSGCGKSTFMKLVSGLRPSTLGKVLLDGNELKGPARMVGMAFQASTLLPWRTTLQNVFLPFEIVEPFRRDYRRKRQLYCERARALINAVGLQGFEDKLPRELSGGMQQRASICRALVHEPRLLLLDEPFAALDAFTREELWCVLRDLWVAKKFTVVLVTHDLREAVFLADTVYVMSRRPGRVVRTYRIGLQHPRDLDVTYTPAFAEIVHELRGYIGRNQRDEGRK
jgi:NitT/TauT family transport system ATP-binding protein